MQQEISTTNNQESTLIQKIRNLAPDKIAEVADFLSQKGQEHQMLQAANKLAENSLNKVWDNAEDEAYDSL
jgi:hypothetical protein